MTRRQDDAEDLGAPSGELFDPAVLGVDPRAFLAALLNAETDAVVVFDRQERIVYANAAATRLRNVELTSAVGHTVGEMTGRIDLQRRVRQALAGLPVPVLVTSLPTPAGDRLVSSQMTTVRDRRGAICAAIAIARDVTDDHKMRKVLAAERELSARVVENTTDFVAVVDLEYRYVLWNSGAERMTRIPRDAILGQTMHERVPPASRERALERARRALAGETLIQSEPELLHQHDGKPAWVTGTWSPVRDEEGRVVGALAVRHDVTEREEARHEQERNRRLLALGRLVGGVAHEIRNPLFGISASLDALELGLGDAREHQPLRAAIRREVHALRSLVDELLAYGRPTSNPFVVVPIRVALDEALRASALVAASRNVDVRSSGALEAPVRCDLQRLPRLFTNVIDNALRFSPEGACVDVEVASSPAGVVVSVADRGPGFPADSLTEVFEPFFSKRAGGTGLGLAIAAQIAAEHQGRIEAALREGGGGLVRVHLPGGAAP